MDEHAENRKQKISAISFHAELLLRLGIVIQMSVCVLAIQECQ